MGERTHRYQVHLTWTGQNKEGQADGQTPFRRHSRDYRLESAGKPAIEGSSDVAFRGDARRWNPEDLLLASLAACHKLWYMGLCASEDITVLSYEDAAEGTMEEDAVSGAGQFTEVILRPKVCIAEGSDLQIAEALHHAAHQKCFIARSVNFPVRHLPEVSVASR